MVSLEDVTMAAFAASNSLRLFAYLPQMHKAAKAAKGTSAISFTTWGLFLAANVSTVAYAVVHQSDWWMAGCFALNASCCLVILLIAGFKSLRHADVRANAASYRANREDAVVP